MFGLYPGKWPRSIQRKRYLFLHKVTISADNRSGVCLMMEYYTVLKNQEDEHYILGQLRVLFFIFNSMPCIFS